MEENLILSVNTKMEKEDYKKFLYIATFKKNPKVILMIIAFSLLGALFASWAKESLTVGTVLVMWALLAAVLVLGIMWKINVRYKQRVETDKTGFFGSTIKYSFFTDHVLMENEALNGSHDLEYSQFHKILDCKDFYILYYNSNSATLIRKKDVKDIVATTEFLKSTFKSAYKAI